MKRRIIVVTVAVLSLALGACSSVSPEEGCRGHGGVSHINEDATNSQLVGWCKDGTIFKVDM